MNLLLKKSVTEHLSFGCMNKHNNQAIITAINFLIVSMLVEQLSVRGAARPLLTLVHLSLVDLLPKSRS